MAGNKVDICGLDTSKLPRLSHEAGMEMLKRIKEGDAEARHAFIEANIRLVLSVLQRFTGRGRNMDDLFQVGCIGLIKAIDNFDMSFDVRFSTYAVPMILGELRRFLRDDAPLRISRSIRDTACQALHIINRITADTGEDPSLADVAKELGLPEEDIVFALEAMQEPVSLFEPVYHDEGDALYVMDQVKDDTDTDENWLTAIAISDGLSKLTERERRILTLRFFQGRTQMEVAGDIAISQAQVSRLEKQALLHMRRYVTDKN